MLQEAGVLAPEVPPERVTADALDRLGEHQLLLNAVAIQCRVLDRAAAGFRVRFLSSTSPFHLSDLDGTILADRIDFLDGSELGFVLDAAFAISHAGAGKTLLFCLEVDMGTETLVDPKGRWDRDLWGKVVVHRTHLGRQGYRRYESDGFLGAPLDGFRLLMVCASTQRTYAVCRMVARNRPSDFVWVTAAPDLLRMGLGGYVWKRGRNLSRAGLAETVAREKAANIDDQRPAIQSLGPKRLAEMIQRIFDGITDEGFELARIAEEYGVSCLAAASQLGLGLEISSFSTGRRLCSPPLPCAAARRSPPHGWPATPQPTERRSLAMEGTARGWREGTYAARHVLCVDVAPIAMNACMQVPLDPADGA